MIQHICPLRCGRVFSDLATFRRHVVKKHNYSEVTADLFWDAISDAWSDGWHTANGNRRTLAESKAIRHCDTE